MLSDINDQVFKDNKCRVAIPFDNLATLIKKSRIKPQDFQIELHGYSIYHGEEVSYLYKSSEVIKTYCYVLEYDDLLDYQRLIDTSVVKETTVDYDNEKYLLYELIDFDSCSNIIKGRKLWNKCLEDISAKKCKEWEYCADVEVLLPVEYSIAHSIDECAAGENTIGKMYLDYLIERENSERNESVKFYNKKKSIKTSEHKMMTNRQYLGKKKIKVLVDYPCDNPNDDSNILGTFMLADMFLSFNLNSSCGVLHIVILSLPNLISHFMDNVISNALFIENENNEWVNIVTFIREEYRLEKRGTAKILTTFFKDREGLPDNYVCSLLLSEVIYNKEDSLGQIIDKDVLSIANNKQGMGQFDRAKIYAYTNSLLQFMSSEYSHLLIKDRLKDETVECYYIELLCLEEASVNIAQNSIDLLLADPKSKMQFYFLMRNIKIYKAFVNTMNFWNFEPMYPAAQKSLKMVRDAFKIDDMEERINKNFDIVNRYYSTLEDYNSFISAVIITLVARIITITTIIDKINELKLDNGWDIKNISYIVILVLMFFVIPRVVRLLVNISNKKDSY